MSFILEKEVKVALLSDFFIEKDVFFCLLFDFRVKFRFLCDF